MHTSFSSDNGMRALSVEQIDDELIVFDPVHMHYHTLNASAAEIWGNCLDASNPADAVDRVSKRYPEWSTALIRQTVDELRDLGLVEWSDREEASLVSRRTVTKLGIGVAAGAVGLPVIRSITVPSSQAAATDDSCPEGMSCRSNGYCWCDGKICATPQCPPPCTDGKVCVDGGCLIPCVP